MAKEVLGWEFVEEGFREALDCDGAVKVGGLQFYPSEILEKLDPIAFREGVNDYADMLAEDYAVEGVNEEEAEEEEEEDNE